MSAPALQAYLDRIGFSGRVEPTLDCLRQVHRRQALTVPYENLDVQLGIATGTSVEAAFDKIVTRRRGGWCYEQNGLLGWALSEIGFNVTRGVGAVMRDVRGESAWGNHLILLVRLDGIYLADIGLGDGLRGPIPMEEGSHSNGALRYGLERLPDGHWRFHNHRFGYPPSFDFAEPDGEGMTANEAVLAAKCTWLQSSPDSVFVQNLTCQIVTDETSTCLTGRVLERKSLAGSEKTLLRSPTELKATLDREFGIGDLDVEVLWPKIAARHRVVFGDRSIEEVEIDAVARQARAVT